MYNLIIRNGRVVDGSGLPAFTADVAVTEGRVARIGRIGAEARHTIDAEGRVVARDLSIHTRILTPSCSGIPWRPHRACTG